MLPIGNCEAQINVTPIETIMSVAYFRVWENSADYHADVCRMLSCPTIDSLYFPQFLPYLAVA